MSGHARAWKAVRFRRRLFRSFQAWYADNEARCQLQLILCRRTDRVLEMTVTGGAVSPGAVRVMIVYHDSGYQELSVAFLHHGEVVDHGFSDYVLPLRVKGGVRCGECARLGEPAPVFQNRHALWAAHLFESLLAWLNSQLATAIGIEYVVFRRGSTAVKLLHAA